VYQPRNWVEDLSPVDSLNLLRELARRHAERGGSFGEKLLKLIAAGDYAAICAVKLEYGSVWAPQELYHCAQALAFFQKVEWLDIGLDLRRKAEDDFEVIQTKNKATNDFIRSVRKGDVSLAPRVSRVIYEAQRTIASILGDIPTLSHLGLRFGKGGTTLTAKRSASRREKLSAGVSCSKELFPLAVRLLEEMPALTTCASVLTRVDEDGEEWDSVPVRIDPGKLNLVPKKATALRIAITEPVLNGMFQMAVGDHLVGRLKRWGIDLTDQRRNQDMAHRASLTDDSATVDLSDASSLISTEVVFELLPLDWATFLARGRTGSIDWQGREAEVQWFSSMGNGYTFPLETLIFYSLARACMVDFDPSRLAVYGDDIILPSSDYALLREVFTALGFVINERKTFLKGPFRESCGGDYYLGTDVRPFFQKKGVSPRTLFALHNFYKARGMDDDASYVVGLIHPSLRDYGPPAYGDGHLHTTSNQMLRKRQHKEKGWSGFTFRTHSPVNRRDDAERSPEGDYAYALYKAYAAEKVKLFRLSVAELLFQESNVRGPVTMLPVRAGRLNIFKHRIKGTRGYGYFEVSESSPSVTSGGSPTDAFPLTEDGVSEVRTIYTFG